MHFVAILAADASLSAAAAPRKPGPSGSGEEPTGPGSHRAPCFWDSEASPNGRSSIRFCCRSEIHLTVVGGDGSLRPIARADFTQP